MKIFQFLFIAFFLFVGTSNVNAQRTPKLTKTQVKQQKRIKSGVQNKDLTKRETKQLANQQRNIQQTKKSAKADGHVSRRERAQIRRKQKNASANIYLKKNNNRDRN